MIHSSDLTNRREKLSLIGLGYVGLPIAVAFDRMVDVIGYDVNSEKIHTYQSGCDPTWEVGNDALARSSIRFTSDAADLWEARFHIVAVPTPINRDKTPDLSPLLGATRALGRHLQKGSIVVFESTVYPGVTEEVCVPLLEQESGLRCGEDFAVGYSPERINPGDQVHRLETIVKVVSGMDAETLDTVAEVYGLVAAAGVYRAPSIRVAEAAKVIENCQRDLNIALMNELSLIFSRMGIDTLEVLKAAGTKWNFLNFRPGLVGGHCIGVDPYYLTFCAERLGYHSQVILAGRRINDGMGKIVAERTVKLLAKTNNSVAGARIAILGFTFKENCPDTRNTRVIDIVNELYEYGISPLIYDPVADGDEVLHSYGLRCAPLHALHDLDAAVIAVAHDAFLTLDLEAIIKPGGVLADVKGMRGPLEGRTYWRL